MVKIRKKTSRRMSTAMREKITKKASEKKRKDKRASKKDVTWKSKKEKDIGVPNSFPYKDQVLAEQQAEKQRLIEEREAKREAQRNGTATLASTAALAAAVAAESDLRGGDDADDDGMAGLDDGEEALVADSSLKLHAKSLRKVLEASDVVLEVLDARDPIGTRCRAVERELRSLDGGRKKLVLVLNKIDLVPANVVQQWLAYLRTQAPTIPFKSSTQQQRNNLSASSTHTPNSAAGSSTKPLMELIKGFRLTPGAGSSSSAAPIKQSLTIGLIGHPNVGKSSVINTLKRSRACSVAPTPGWTKEVQEIVLEKGVRVLDCPGVVVEARGEVEGALKGTVRLEDVADIRAPVELILQRCKKEHLQMLYNIPAFNNDVTAFLLEVARAKGRLRKGGIPDLDGSARSVVRDWVAGRIPYYTSPPSAAATSASQAAASSASVPLATVSSADVGAASLHTEFAPAFDLDALFGEADAAAFGDEGVAGSSVAGKGVKMNGGLGDEPEDANVGWVTDAKDEEDDDAMEDDDGTNGVDVDDLLDDDEADEDGDVGMQGQDTASDPTTTAAAGSKRKRGPEIVSVAPTQSASKRSKQTKQVTFSSKPLGPTGSGAPVSGATPAAGPTAAPSAAALNKAQIESELASEIGLNKSLKKQAKKAKRKAGKADKVALEHESAFGQDADMPQTGKAAKAKVVTGMNVDDAYDFAEFFGPGKGNAAAATTADDDDEEL